MSDVLMQTSVLVAQRASLSPIARRTVEQLEGEGYVLNERRSIITLLKSGNCIEHIVIDGAGEWTKDLLFHTGTETRLISFHNTSPEGYVFDNPPYQLTNWMGGWADVREQASIERQGRENAGLELLEQFDVLEDLYRQEDATIPESVYGARMWFVANGYMD